MSTIYKYLIKCNQEKGKMIAEVPKHAEPISILLKDLNTAYLYCIVDPTEKETIEREVLWIGTGWEIDQETKSKINYYTFLGTYEIRNLVWHFWIEPIPNFDFLGICEF